MTTLHSDVCLNQFAAQCATLWNDWRTLSVANRRRSLTNAITSVVQAWMQPPSYTWEVIDHWGAFDNSDWSMEIQKKWTRKRNIPFNKFVELCTTVYHETRHAEQYYRVAQGLATSRITFPSTRRKFTGSQTIKTNIAQPGGGTREIEQEVESYKYKTRDNLFEQFRHDEMQRAPRGGKVKALVAAINRGHKLPDAPIARIGPIQNFLGMSRNAVEHAIRRRASFIGFINSPQILGCMTRSSWIETIKDWRDSFYRTGGQRISEFAQDAEDNEERLNAFTGKVRGNIWEMYVNLPEEKDTYGIEALLKPRIAQRVGLTLGVDNANTPP